MAATVERSICASELLIFAWEDTFLCRLVELGWRTSLALGLVSWFSAAVIHFAHQIAHQPDDTAHHVTTRIVISTARDVPKRHQTSHNIRMLSVS